MCWGNILNLWDCKSLPIQYVNCKSYKTIYAMTLVNSNLTESIIQDWLELIKLRALIPKAKTEVHLQLCSPTIRGLELSRFLFGLTGTSVHGTFLLNSAYQFKASSGQFLYISQALIKL